MTGAVTKDENTLILQNYGDDLLVDVILYFEQSVEVVRTHLETQPFYLSEVVRDSNPSFLQRLRGHRCPPEKVYESFEDPSLNTFLNNRARFTLADISYYTKPAEFLGHTIEIPGLKAPLIEHTPFKPSTTIDVSYLAPSQALQLTQLYTENADAFAELRPFGFLLLRGSDFLEAREALMKLNEKGYLCTEEQRAMVFMEPSELELIE